MPLVVAAMTDADSFEAYIDNIVMKMGEDAIGTLLFILPIVLRI